MRSRLFLACALSLCSIVPACSDKTAAKPPITLVCADAQDEECTKLTDVFATDTPKIFATYTTYDIPKAGTKIHIDWIADDVGKQAPPKTAITGLDIDVTKESLLGGKTGNYYAAKTSLSKPTAGWPAGKYHIEFKFDGKSVSSIPFQILPAAAAPAPAK